MTRSSPRRRSRVEPCSCRALLSSKRRGALTSLRSPPGIRGEPTLRLDQAVEPGDVLLGRVLTVLYQRKRVRVLHCGGAAQRGLDRGQTLLQIGAPALKQPDARLRGEVLEEG